MSEKWHINKHTYPNIFLMNDHFFIAKHMVGKIHINVPLATSITQTDLSENK